jgi:hypothetical protein
MFCGCTYDNPCPNGCGWANRQQTLCTDCVAVRSAWLQRGPQPSHLMRPFFKGFVAGAEDERATESTNPYAVAPPRQAQENPRRVYWQLGFERGHAQKEATSTHLRRHRKGRHVPATALR